MPRREGRQRRAAPGQAVPGRQGPLPSLALARLAAGGALEFRTGRIPLAPLELNPEDAKALGVASGDVVEVSNDYGSVYAMAYLEADIKPKQTFMLFGYPFNVMGDVTTAAVDENAVPYYKYTGTWADIPRVGTLEDSWRTSGAT